MMNRKKTVQNKCRTIKHGQLKSRPKCDNHDHCQFSSRFNSVNTKDCTRRLAPGSHCAGEIWQHSFISTVRPTVHTKSVRKTELYEKALYTGVIWNASFRFRVDGKQFDKGAFWTMLKTMAPRKSCDFSLWVESNTNPNWPVIVAF